MRFRITTVEPNAVCCTCLLLLASASRAPHALAEPSVPKAALIVTRGEGAQDCPDSTALAERVRAVAGANVVSAEPGSTAFETWVQVAIARNFNGYSAQISTSGLRHGNRTLEDVGPSCTNLADAIAVTLAIILDPYTSAPPPKITPSPVPERLPEPKTKAPSTPPRLPRFFLAAGGGVSINLLEHAMPALIATAGLQLTPRWSLLLGGGYVLPDTVASPGGEVELSLAYGDVGACGRALGDSDGLQLNWCMLAMLGPLRGAGRDYKDGTSKSALWLAGSIGPDVVFPITRSFSWLLTGQAVFPLIRNGFDVQSNGVQYEAFRPSSVGALVSLGVRGEL